MTMKEAMPSQPERPYLSAAGRDWLLWLYDPLTRLFGADKVFRAFLEQAALQPDHAVLDVGCGTGTLAVLLKQLHPTIDVTGLDPDPKALAFATRKAKRKGVAVRFDRGFADELPYGDATFDRVFSSMMFHHVPRRDKAKVLEEIRRVLKPGGRLEFLDIAPEGEDRMLGRLHEAGFVDARKVGERKLVFGRIAFHQARR
jgi:ubiquinone/menaquinone biosynthesis C-methylase UbiE